MQDRQTHMSVWTMNHIRTTVSALGRFTTRGRLFYLNYERHPGPINVTTAASTVGVATSPHPLQIRTRRRHRDFDAGVLHWRVNAPADLSKSAFVRDRVKRRVREAFLAELKDRGWQTDGSVSHTGDAAGKVQETPLKGAAMLALLKDDFVIEAPMHEVRKQVSWAVDRLVAWQGEGAKPSWSSHTRNDGFGEPSYARHVRFTGR